MSKSHKRRSHKRSNTSTSTSSSSSSSHGKRHGRRHKRGGDGESEGASNWVMKNFGDLSTQWNNTFGTNGSAHSGNLLPTLSGAPAVGPNNVPQGVNSNVAQNAAPAGKQSGGKRKRARTHKKGGWGQALASALVPLGLFAAQQKYGRRTRTRKT